MTTQPLQPQSQTSVTSQPSQQKKDPEPEKKQSKPLFKTPTNPFAKRTPSNNPPVKEEVKQTQQTTFGQPKESQFPSLGNQKPAKKTGGFSLAADDDYEEDFDQSTPNKFN